MPYSCPRDWKQLLALASSSPPDAVDKRALSTALQTQIQSPVAGFLQLLPRIHARLMQEQDLPPGLRQQLAALQGQVNGLLAQSAVQQQWLRRNLRRFQLSGIPVILHKASGFNGDLYPLHAPRVAEDIDLLCKPRDFDAACALLRENMQEVVIDPRRARTHASQFERQFVSRDGAALLVEMHRHISNPALFDIPVEALFAQAQPHPVHGAAGGLRLCPEHALIALAVHGARHLTFVNHNLLDCHELLQQYPPSSPLLLETSHAWGTDSVLYLLLHSHAQCLDGPAGMAVLHLLRPNAVRRQTARLLFASLPITSAADTGSGFNIRRLLSQWCCSASPWHAMRHQLRWLLIRLRDWLRL